MDPSNNTRLQLFLSNTVNCSTVSPVMPPRAPLTPTSPNPSCRPVLPYPPGILSELESTGLPAPTVSQLLGIYQQGCQSFRRQTEAAMASLPVDSAGVMRIFERMYSKRVESLKRRLLQQMADIVGQGKKKSKATFHPEFTPLLTNYFEDNAYPSAADRNMLAQKTQMAPRQIEVWFQNHRRRARANGKALPRRQYDANPDDYNLKSIGSKDIDHKDSPSPCRSVLTATKPPELGESRQFSGRFYDRSAPIKSVFQWISHPCVDIVKGPVPSRAFPTPFSPSHTNKTFPFEPCYADFEWPRKASEPTKLSNNHKHVDMAAFVHHFQSRLRIFEKSVEKSGARNPKRKRPDDLDDLSVSLSPTNSLITHFPSQSRFSQTRPAKRRHVQTPRGSFYPSSSFTPSSPCHSDCSRSTSSSYLATPPTKTISSPRTVSLPQDPLDQRFSWHTSKFVEWSSIPPLALNCSLLNLTLSAQLQ